MSAASFLKYIGIFYNAVHFYTYCEYMAPNDSERLYEKGARQLRFEKSKKIKFYPKKINF